MDALVVFFFLFPTSGILAPSSFNSLRQFKVKRKIKLEEGGGRKPTWWWGRTNKPIVFNVINSKINYF